MSSLRDKSKDESVDWMTSIPFILMHVMPLFAFVTGVDTSDLILCFALYYLRMFFITAGYHRYFAHRAFKTGRIMQFIFAFGGATAAQKGPLWWAGYHRHHHKYSDTDEDIHSPKRGFWWAHMGWILCPKYDRVPTELIEDFAKYPELRLLERFWLAPPIIMGALVLLIGGPSALITGFFLSTILLYHGVFCVNSLAHVFGTRRFATRDTSRNSFIISLMTLGEGWHNNHHHYQSAAKAGFFWWEIDVSYYIIRTLAAFGIVYNLRQVPASLLEKKLIRDGHFDVGMFENYWGLAQVSLDNVRDTVRGFCDAKTLSLEAFLAEKRSGAEDKLAQLRQQAGSLQINQNAFSEYLSNLKINADEFLERTSKQTHEYCESQSRSLQRALTLMHLEAGDFYDAKKTAAEEILSGMRQNLDDYLEAAQRHSLALADLLADLEARSLNLT